MKNNTETPMILLVLLVKSADASITSIAVLRDLCPQHTRIMKIRPQMPVIIPTYNRVLSETFVLGFGTTPA